MPSALDPDKITDPSSNDEILSAFLDWLIKTKVEPYDQQEEAILALFSGNNVILNTPSFKGFPGKHFSLKSLPN